LGFCDIKNDVDDGWESQWKGRPAAVFVSWLGVLEASFVGVNSTQPMATAEQGDGAVI
jgi:hypothetical protein